MGAGSENKEEQLLWPTSASTRPPAEVAAEKTTPNGARTANGSSKDRSEEAEAVDEERADGGGQTKTCEGQGEERHQGAEATRGVEEAGRRRLRCCCDSLSDRGCRGE